jgi:subtilisin family serine protease
VLSLFGGSAVLAVDPERPSRPAPTSVDDLRLDQPVTGASVARPSVLDASLLSATGTRQVVVRLSADSVGDVAAAGGGPAAQRRALGTVTTQQDQFLARYNESVLGRVQVALNAVILEVDADGLAALAADPSVERITPVIDYTLDLEDTVPYIGASAVQDAGFDGTGVTVAVLDSGIDYTHAAFGDLATVHDYDAAYGANTNSQENRDQPDWAEVAAHTNIVGGFDYVGEVWPDGRLAPDPDPIDCGGKTIGTSPDLCEGGHGTHVADIIGGIAGVAPGVELHAIKVCSAVSTSCSGVALLLGMDHALDPNADGDTADHVDVINMSLGSPYGQAFDDDLSLAVDTATDVGVLTVTSAGNSSDKPYVTGTPGAAPSALSVAQTAVPSDVLPLLEVTDPESIAGLYPAVFQPWSEPLEVDGAILDAPLQYGNGAGGNLNGCTAFPADSLTGLVVLVDRGACDFSLKIANVAAGGAEAGIIGLIAPGEPFTGALGACPSDLCGAIPGFMVHQATSAALKAGETGGGTIVSLDPASGLDLVGTMVGSSSRGPTMLTNVIKPEIGAPGASISAEAGTATETTPFGGTSGAAPMVTGSAALLMEALAADERSPAEIKSLLMNYAETEIYNGAPDAPISAPLAAIQRIGAGEVRVNQSLDGADFAAWDSEQLTGALSFGFVDSWEETTVLTREVTVANYSDTEQVFDITPTFRFQNDADNGAVEASAPAQVTVPADDTATFEVSLSIDTADLRLWSANSGGDGANALLFDLLEYDGYLELSAEGLDTLHLAWHVLPRQSGATSVGTEDVVLDEEAFGFPAGTAILSNAGAGLSAMDGYSLVGESGVLPTGGEGAGLPTVDLRYAGVQTIPVESDFCTSEFLLLLAVNTFERQTHANAPAAFEWDIDTDGDGDYDWAVFNLELASATGGVAYSDGRNLVVAAPFGAGGASAFFFTDHATNSGNTVLTICGEQIGLTADDFGTELTADVLAVDTYFTGRVTDVITDVRFAPLGERYFPVIGDAGFGVGEVPAGDSVPVTVLDFGTVGTNVGELGVLLLADGTRVEGSTVFKTGAPQDLEAIVLRPQVVSGLPFDDIAGSPFINDILWAYENGVTTGCSTNPPLFCPNQSVLRDQMATFLDRVLDLPEATMDHFTDDNGNIHEAAINRLAEAGVTTGCGGGKYCPSAPVARDQMASFLVRAFELPATATDYFTDDTGNIHEENINALRESGITTGCTATTFCPAQLVTRAQMTAFLHRAVGD